MQYGQILEEYEPDVEVMYKAFTTFFNNPTMTKTKDVNKYSVYMSKTYCLLSNECRYLVAMVQRDNRGVGTLESLDTMQWVSFQTRTLRDIHDLPPHAYNAKRGGPLDCEIVRTQNENRASTYKCENFPIEISILHTGKGPSEYQDRGTIIAALETYQTIVKLNNRD